LRTSIIEGEVASGLLGFGLDLLGKISDFIGSEVFPDAGINPGHDGVFAVIALSGSPFGDANERSSVIGNNWQRDLWFNGLAINIVLAALDSVGVACDILGVDISPFLEELFLQIRMAATDNPENIGIDFITGKTAEVTDRLLDFLRPWIHSKISDVGQQGLKTFLHVNLNAIARIYGTFSGTVKASSRILNFMFTVTPRESGYVIIGNALGSTPDTTRPAPPAGLNARAVSESQINLSWTASIGSVAGYRVYRNGIKVQDNLLTTSFSDMGLSPSTYYCYNVTAYNLAGESSASGEKCATTLAVPDKTAPSVPTGLTATAISASKIDLSWMPSTDNVGVDFYKLYRSDGFYYLVDPTSLTDTKVAAGTTYCYRVSAFDFAGNESGQSSQVCARTPQVLPPSLSSISLNPANGTAIVGDNTLQFAATGLL
jgi:chitodextrinase